MSGLMKTPSVLLSQSLVGFHSLYRVLRGEMKAFGHVRKMSSSGPDAHGCVSCMDTGCARKIVRFPQRTVEDAERREGELSMGRVFEVGAVFLGAKGGCESAIIEQIFSICRMLGLRQILRYVTGM